MTSKYGPYTFRGAVDCGHLIDLIERDVATAKAKGREAAIWMLEQVKRGHSDWLEGHHLSGRALRRAGTPFSAAYDDLEHWLAQTTPRKQARPKRGFVYVIGFEADSTAVKIGFASDVEDRRCTLQTSSHRVLKVLAVINGTIATEKGLHREFAADHIRGEWFRLSPQIEVFIAQNSPDKK